MSVTSERADAVGRAIARLELDFLAYVPSNTIAPIINHFRGPAAPTRPCAFPVAREEEAVGIIGAVSLANRHGAILMQDNGFGNALTALTTFAVAYHRPLLIVANTRGGLGEYNSMIHTISGPCRRCSMRRGSRATPSIGGTTQWTGKPRSTKRGATPA